MAIVIEILLFEILLTSAATFLLSFTAYARCCIDHTTEGKHKKLVVSLVSGIVLVGLLITKMLLHAAPWVSALS